MRSWLSKRSVHEDDLVDLHGKVAIVTGGNTGIGYATIHLQCEHKVYMAARDEGRARTAIEQLKREDIGDGVIEWLQLNLSDPRLAKGAAEEFLQKEDRLDILGEGSFGPFKLDSDGLLDIMVSNHISHFIFTETLRQLLESTSKEDGSDVRIVNVTSMAHSRVHPEAFIGKEALNKDYGQSVNGYLDTYGNSKLANVLHVKELQRQLDREGFPITCIAVHPGAVKTVGSDAFLDTLPYFGPFVKRYIGPLFFGTWRNGAMNTVFAAASKNVQENRVLYQGAYISPVARVTAPSKDALDPRLANELWATTEDVLRELGVWPIT
ncbi:hypothetical protein B0H34DRAFT_750303 [Crassisporium funariophilum]|nr:hypothetical protein B0H34DRAFT_750303 [Crassisporium funariophilum]